MTFEEVVRGARSNHELIRLEVTGGFLDGVTVDFASGLNCIIGGRGTGKTTTLEFVRYALAAGDELNGSPESKQFSRLLQGNLRGGSVRLTVKAKHGAEFVVERPLGESAQVLDDKGELTTLSIGQVFQTDIYSQHEIERIAAEPALQLRLLDRFSQAEIVELEVAERSLLRSLSENAGALAGLEGRLRDDGEVAQGRASIEAKLAHLRKEAAEETAGELEAAHAEKAKRETEKLVLDGVAGDVDAAKRGLAQTFAESIAVLENRVESGEDGTAATLLDGVRDAVSTLVTELREADRLASAALERAGSQLGEAAEQVLKEHGESERAYRALLGASEVERERASERAQLEKRLVQVLETERASKQRAERCTALRAERSRLMAELSAVRDKRFSLRKQVAESLSNALEPTVFVSVEQAADRDEYRERLREALRGSGIRYGHLVDRIVELVPPEELAATIWREDAAGLAELLGARREQVQRIAEVLRERGSLFDLEVVNVEDRPRIQLRDGEEYKDSQNLSAGQRCTAILSILLLQSDRPLVIDQPEDNLDNAFIYETVVRSVRDAQRQLVFVTHNPNIPVLGEADRVFVMSSDGKRASVAAVGTVDDVKEHIETLLEGGREAFLRRKERYGH